MTKDPRKEKQASRTTNMMLVEFPTIQDALAARRTNRARSKFVVYQIPHHHRVYVPFNEVKVHPPSTGVATGPGVVARSILTACAIGAIIIAAIEKNWTTVLWALVAILWAWMPRRRGEYA